jgi:beta-glucosidase
MRILSLLVVASVVLCVMSTELSDKQVSARDRARALVSQMTLDEKLSLVHGVKGPYVGNTATIDRLGIPALTLEDGPQGVADGTTHTTCWPAAISVSASWDLALMRDYASAMAEEQRVKGTNVMLGPMVNVARVPYHGRGFEGFGEDPMLSSQMAFEYVTGVQSQGVMATAKHYINNHQETDRFSVSANVGMRAEHELYLKPFKAAVDAGVAAIMCSYNKINDTFACENDVTLNQLLRGELGFQGFVMSDWGATHSTVQAVNAGLDQEMADDQFYGAALNTAIQNGEIAQDKVDNMVVNMVSAMYQVGIMDRAPSGNLQVDSRSAEHTALATRLAEESTVLLKNFKNVLPLSSKLASPLAVLGGASKNPVIAGFGSGHVLADTVSTPYDALSKVVQVTSDLSVANAAIIFVGVTSSEGYDRANLSLSDADNQLITETAQQMRAANKPVIVVLQTVGAVLLPWIDMVDAVVCVFMPGQEHGTAITRVLFGDVNPSGRLPITFPKSEDQVGFSPSQYPGVDLESAYSEELLVGYRWYNARSLFPLFPFGHGLSYTQFRYDNLRLRQVDQDTVTAVLRIANVGFRAGATVAQLYVTFPSEANEPPLQLKGFAKLFLYPGESNDVFISFSFQRDLQVWDNEWKFIEGDYQVAVGESSRTIHVIQTIHLPSAMEE